jgi:hypothetical protein
LVHFYFGWQKLKKEVKRNIFDKTTFTSIHPATHTAKPLHPSSNPYSQALLLNQIFDKIVSSM